MDHNLPDSRDSKWRTLVALAIGALGALVIWLVVPYNNFILHNANISDSYLPPAVVLLTLLLVGVNVVFRLLRRPGWTLTRRQLALAIGIMLVACVLPSQGLLRNLPYALVKTTHDASQNKFLAERLKEMDLPPSLFPEKIAFGEATPVSDDYIDEVAPGGLWQRIEQIPWRAWLGPMISWGVFLTFCWMMMIGLAMIVFPQWRYNERLAFPLLTVQGALIDTPEPGRLLPPLLRSRAFWIASAAVFVVHQLAGWSTYYPDSVPTIPLDWNLSHLFTEEPWRQMPGYVRMAHVYFLFVGVAFFMPSRISFSIWFFLIAYGLYRCLAPVYGVQDFIPKMDDHRFGAVIALAVGVLVIGRSHWAATFVSMFRRPQSDADSRNRTSGWLFVAGLIGMGVCLLYVGVQIHWALLLVAFAFIVTLLISRIVAETGMPFVRLYENPYTLMQLAPLKYIGAVSLYFSVVFDLLFSWGSRVNPTAMATHALGLNDRPSPRRQRNIGVTLLICLVVGLVIAGGANLIVSYTNSTAFDGTATHASGQSHLDTANARVMELSRGTLSDESYNRYTHLTFGAALAGLLYYLTLTSPVWPLHPFGMMLIDSHYGHTTWASIFIGWACQILIVRFGGSRLYRMARPVFLGLIVGEIAAAIFWGIVPIALASKGILQFKQVNVLPT